MTALKRAATLVEPGKSKSGARFYKSFMDSVRVREMEFMTKYFMSVHEKPGLASAFHSSRLEAFSQAKDIL